MDRVQKIFENETYQKYLEMNNSAEADRRFCRHNLQHFLDVARIAMILNLEEGYGCAKSEIYAAALLHDIGRWRQYEDGTPHETASAGLAPGILNQAGYEVEEKQRIIEAIWYHRNAAIAEEKSLKGLLYRADKLSRGCFGCEAESECNWKGDKKNLTIQY